MKQTDAAGKSRRIRTAEGEQLGLTIREQQGRGGTCQTVYYPPKAQQFIFDHPVEMLQEKKQEKTKQKRKENWKNDLHRN